MSRKLSSTILSILLFTSSSLLAAPQSEIGRLSEQLKALQSTVTELQTLVRSQQSELAALKLKPAVPVQLSTTQSKQGLRIFNPEIGVVGDILASSTQSREDAEGNDRVALREIGDRSRT